MNSITSTAIADNWLDAALCLIYPPMCQVCGNHRANAVEGYVCPQCCSKVRYIEPPFCGRCGLPYPGDLTTSFECTNCRDMDLYFRSARSAVAAGGIILEIIHRYKYQRALWFESFLAGVFLRQALKEIDRDAWDVIVPVPLHPVKEREREFNQAARMADHLGAATGICVNENLLYRVTPTRTQTLLSREDRAKNVKNAFACRKEKLSRDSRIILVDDVFTTGATTNACAKALQKAGAADVCVWTVARGL
jgi:competence protein ComFC